jgi:hypothetical protein
MFNSSIGIEIEFIRKKSEKKIREILSPYNWLLEEEKGSDNTLELISPPLIYSESREKIKDIFSTLESLEKNGFISTKDKKNCGIHTHWDIYTLDIDQIKKLIYNWNLYRERFLSLVSPFRLNNEWCLPYDNLSPDLENCESVRDIVDILQKQNGKCYQLNLRSYFKFATIEVRILESTTNFSVFEDLLNMLSNYLFQGIYT